jgi:hypothetical protein
VVADRRIAIALSPTDRAFPGRTEYRPFVAAPGEAHARLCLCGISPAELPPSWQADAGMKGELFVGRPILSCPTVERRYDLREANEVVVPYAGVVDFFRPSTRDLESYTLGSGGLVRHLHGRLLCLLGSILASEGGLLLHGSGVLIDGAGAAVIGPSGAGKTTAAHLLRPDCLLSDDAIAVTDVDAQPQLHATPLGRESDGPGSAPLRAILFPRKQSGFSLQPLTSRQALIRSTAEQADKFQCLSNPYGGMSIRNLARLFRKVPAYELGFSLDGIDRDAIRRVLSRSQDPE